jgi:hypothetical protein
MMEDAMQKIYGCFSESCPGPDTVVSIIEGLKKKVHSLEMEIAEAGAVRSIDAAMHSFAKKDQKYLSTIEAEWQEQVLGFNRMFIALKEQVERKNAGRDELVEILRHAEDNNYRLLQILDPPIRISPHSGDHIGMGEAIRPFSRGREDLFRKRRGRTGELLEPPVDSGQMKDEEPRTLL